MASGFTTGAEVQVDMSFAEIEVHVYSMDFLWLCQQTAVLDQAAATFPPDTSWWIKGDAVDLVAGLGESVSCEWLGDADLGDGHLQEMFKQYQRRLQMIKSIGLKNRTGRIDIVADLQEELALLDSDLEFLVTSMFYNTFSVLYACVYMCTHVHVILFFFHARIFTI